MYRLEKIWTDILQDCVVLVLPSWLAANAEIAPDGIVVAQRWCGEEACRGDSRHRGEPLQRLREERSASLRILVARCSEVDVHGEKRLRLETPGIAQHVGESFDHEPSPDEKDQRQRNLRADKGAAKFLRAWAQGRSRSPRLQALAQLRAGALNRGNHAAQDCNQQ